MVLLSRRVHTLIAVLGAALILGPSTTAFGQAPVKSGALSNLEARLTRLERQLSAKTLFELLERLEAVQRDLQALRGDMEIQRHDLERIKARQRELFVDMDRLATRVTTTSVPPAAPVAAPAPNTVASSPSPAPASPPRSSVPSPAVVQPAAPAPSAVSSQATSSRPASLPAPSAQAGDSQAASGERPTSIAAVTPPSPPTGVSPDYDPLEEQSAYAAAFNLLKEGRYEKAAESFERFLVKYQGGQYTDNAQYWLGEAFYVTRKFPRSMQEFQKLVSAYPQSPKVPGAKLKIGFIHQELGEIEQAKAMLGDLVAQFPTTTAARLARDRLDRLARQ